MTDNKNEKDPQTDYCCDCVHAKKFLWRMYCTYSAAKHKFDVVTGKPVTVRVSCDSLRDVMDTRCRHYEARPFAPPRKHMLPVPPLPEREPVQQNEPPTSQVGVTNIQEFITLCEKIRDDASLPNHVHTWASTLLHNFNKVYGVIPTTELKALFSIVNDYDYVRSVVEPRLALWAKKREQ